MSKVSYAGIDFEPGEAELKEYNSIFANRVYYGAFEGLKGEEQSNEKAWPVEKLQLIKDGFLTPSETESFTDMPLKGTLTGPDGEWHGIFLGQHRKFKPCGFVRFHGT